MAREDFINNQAKFLSTNENSGNHIFDVDVSSNIVGLGSLLSVNVNSTKTDTPQIISDPSNEVLIVGEPSPPDLRASTAYFSYGKAPIPGFDEFYYSKAADVDSGETPDLDMSGVIDLMNGGNANLVMIYPDSGGNGRISIDHDKIWEDFNLLDVVNSEGDVINPGYDPDDGSTWAIPFQQRFPQMDPDDYVSAVQFFLEDEFGNKRLEDAAGKAFCFDWEKQTLAVQRLGSIFWNDTSNPKFRDALIELRNQQKAIWDALKVAFPDSFFGMYGGTVDIGQFELNWDGSAFVSGAATRIRWFALLDQSQKDILAQNFKDALAGTEVPWDYVTKVCYDSFAPDSFQLHDERPAKDSTALKPPYKKVLFDWAFGIMKSELTVPCLAVVSPSNIAVFDLGTDPNSQNPLPVPWPDGKYNSSDPYEWANPTTWIEQTIDMIREADGYLIWDGLRIDQTRQFSTNYANWANVVSDGKASQMNEWWNLMEDLEEKYGTLTTIADEFNIPVPTNAETWFNLDRDTLRRTDFYRNAMSKDVIADLESTLIPLIESWRTTRIVPFMIRDQIITGIPNVGETLTIAPAVGDYDRDDVVYAWSLGTNAEIIGDDSTLVIPQNALNTIVKCNITYTRNGDLLQEVDAETGIILLAGSRIVNSEEWELSVEDQAIFTTVPNANPIRIVLSAGQETFSIGFAGSVLSDINVEVDDEVIFTVNEVDTDPTTIQSIDENGGVTINLSSTGNFATAIANGAVGEEISFIVRTPVSEPVSTVSRITDDVPAADTVDGVGTFGVWELSVEDQAIFTTFPTEEPISNIGLSAGQQTFSISFAGSVLSDINVEVGDKFAFVVNGVVTSPTTIDSIIPAPAGSGDSVSINLINTEDFATAIATGEVGEVISIVEGRVGTLSHFQPNVFSQLTIEPSGWLTFTDNEPFVSGEVANIQPSPAPFVIGIPDSTINSDTPTIKSSINTDSLFTFTIKRSDGSEITVQARPSEVNANSVVFIRDRLIERLMDTNNTEVISITFTN